MSVSRRKFIRSSAALSAVLVLKPGTLILGQDSMWSNNTKTDENPDQAKYYTWAMFEPYVGDTFRVHAGTQTVYLKLVALADLNSGSARTTTKKTHAPDCFSLQFKSSTPLPATASTHTLNHSVLGSFDLCMTQSGVGAEFVQMAIVNHAVNT